MEIRLKERTAETVKIYFEKANTPEIRKVLPQKAQTAEEALADFQKTLLPGAASYGRTIYADGAYIGDVWCYCIDPNEEPNCMLSYCIFDKRYWSQGIATEAVRMFMREMESRYSIRSIGAFAFEENAASLRVLAKNGFSIAEEFEEDGRKSVYLQWES